MITNPCACPNSLVYMTRFYFLLFNLSVEETTSLAKSNVIEIIHHCGRIVIGEIDYHNVDEMRIAITLRIHQKLDMF